MFRQIVSQHGNILSKPTLIKDINELEDEHKISVVRESARQDVMITTYSKANEALKMLEKSFVKIMSEFEKYLQTLIKKSPHLSDDEKASYFLSMIRMIQFENWSISNMNYHKIKSIEIMEEKLEYFRHKVYHSIITCSPKGDPLRIFNLINESYTMESKMMFNIDYSRLQKL